MNFPFLELKKVEKDLGDVPGVQGLVLLAHKALDRIVDLEAELAKWKRLYENTIVQKEGMELYDEIKRLSNRVYELEQFVKKGVWPK